MNKGPEKMIVLNGPMTLSKEDGEFVNEKNLSSADMFRIFGIVAERALGIKMKKYHFDPGKVQTTLYLE